MQRDQAPKVEGNGAALRGEVQKRFSQDAYIPAKYRRDHYRLTPFLVQRKIGLAARGPVLPDGRAKKKDRPMFFHIGRSLWEYGLKPLHMQ
jgi:hypothetical protein